jgi:ubiquinone/menaquinone biosynthesis C-methylase UbiE
MKTDWDYTELADAYLKRPDYSPQALTEMLRVAGVSSGVDICDVGAGVGHLTKVLGGLPLSRVTAVEPNDAMRRNGMKALSHLKNVQCIEGSGEDTGCPSDSFDLVTFGSSFNVTDQQAALKETARILKPRGWFACMWNHRDLKEPIQARFEEVIRAHLPDYAYGTRRSDQAGVINASGLYGHVINIEGGVCHVQGVEECIEAWRSHATLRRQAGDDFPAVVRDIGLVLRDLNTPTIVVPFVTRIWLAQLL